MSAPPSALAQWDEIARRLQGARPALFLDYDGTLTPIVARPELATLPPETRSTLERLAKRFPVAILSGRAREDVAALVGLPDLVYAGSHGFDIAGPGLRHEVGGEELPKRMSEAAAELRRVLQGIPGILVEDKRFAVAVHYRLVAEADLPRIERAVDTALAARPELRKAGGKKVFELRPSLDWDKGKALAWLLDRLAKDSKTPLLPVYIGDDVTDEDAFRAIGSNGITVLVADEPRETAAGYSLRNPDEVRQLLERLAELPHTSPA
ncbi:MAG TPA: trehalose-phosphatase [Thermoanaerobaculia bacterium]|nr:trehalose-phosphatase [Thermoanaerobaculia bacterium]